MEAGGESGHELMHDVKAVDWLRLAAAVERLSRGYERAFLENVGPIALAAVAETMRRPRAKPPAPEKRRSRRPVAPPPSVIEPMPPSAPSDSVSLPAFLPVAPDDRAAAGIDGVETEIFADAAPSAIAPSFAPEPDAVATGAVRHQRRNLIQKVRDSLRRAA